MPDPPRETASSQTQQIDVSNSDTISLISSLLDAKLQKTFGDFRHSLDECEVETPQELKKLKTDSKAASSLQFKGVQEHLQKAKCDLKKCFKLICFATGWAAVKEYELDELAENSEDEKKL